MSGHVNGAALMVPTPPPPPPTPTLLTRAQLTAPQEVKCPKCKGDDANRIFPHLWALKVHDNKMHEHTPKQRRRAAAKTVATKQRLGQVAAPPAVEPPPVDVPTVRRRRGPGKRNRAAAFLESGPAPAAPAVVVAPATTRRKFAAKPNTAEPSLGELIDYLDAKRTLIGEIIDDFRRFQGHR